ncbi:hypothetical protein D3C87_1448430 [compost metagenome]
MLSIPPATTTSALPAWRRSWPNISAFMPEPHILLTVEHTTCSGRFANRAAWRAGAWPCPACSTHPMMTSPMSLGCRLARSTAARIATAPSCAGVTSLKFPRKPPNGVRAALTMTIGSVWLITESSVHVGGLVPDYRLLARSISRPFSKHHPNESPRH